MSICGRLRKWFRRRPKPAEPLAARPVPKGWISPRTAWPYPETMTPQRSAKKAKAEPPREKVQEVVILPIPQPIQDSLPGFIGSGFESGGGGDFGGAGAGGSWDSVSPPVTYHVDPPEMRIVTPAMTLIEIEHPSFDLPAPIDPPKPFEPEPIYEPTATLDPPAPPPAYEPPPSYEPPPAYEPPPPPAPEPAPSPSPSD